MVEVLAQLAARPCWEPELLGLDQGKRPMHRLRALQFVVAHGLARKEPRGPYGLTIGLLAEWLRWSGAAGAQENVERPPAGQGTQRKDEGVGHTVVIAASGARHEARIELRRMLEEAFQPHELELLADELGVDLARIASPGLPLANQALALVRWAEQNGQFDRLRELLQRERPAFGKRA
jgi:hypothetical protein